ncbi:putative uncharacterized protein [Waddlia chondrophila 2032/99]|uniref:Uncharacterized protein n=2 Tax=Waddlia chondrophila TaxID=71667 RepID=D6YTC7_WADCW|nr:hypothetical protein wcw_0011 [Waddlia chondrophila WSU 86-1044]CCB90580.1 putative uncharacterized protein [Waddlia chondrophila 2032/99]
MSGQKEGVYKLTEWRSCNASFSELGGFASTSPVIFKKVKNIAKSNSEPKSLKKKNLVERIRNTTFENISPISLYRTLHSLITKKQKDRQITHRLQCYSGAF